MSFTNKIKTKKLGKKTTLIDLRSRALLLKNSERKESEGQVNQEELNTFVDYIDLCLDIGESLFELYSSGNFDFMKVHLTAKPSELQHKKETLKSALSDWNACLHSARMTYFLLNYVNGTQIHVLYKYLEEIESDTVAVQTMLRFIHPDLKILDMRFVYKQEKDTREIWNEESKLQCIGFTLHSSFHDLGIYERPITDDNIGMSTTITGKVKTSRLLVAQLEEGSIYTVKTVIALYSNTTRRLPEPNQLLFCTRFTTWAEIDLHIRRCLGADSFYGSVPLFCIANVELLPNEIQFGLVDVLRHLDKKHKFLLAIVCRGTRSHPFIDELSEYVTSVAPASDKKMKQIFIEHCRDVLTVTSDYAGQGKSSLIRRIAHDSNKGVIRLHISGPVRKLTLVERLLSLKIKETHLLHIDLGSVEDPTEVDTFLFELIVLRHVSAERLSFSLCIEDVKIEVGNTIRDALRNSLQTTVLFQREHIAWKGIKGVSISKEPDSSVQVVCRYLKGLDENTLDNTDFQTTGEKASLSRAQCRFLLSKFVGDEFCVSFPIFITFLDVLADQLRKMSNSTFFKVSRLRDMVGSKSPIAVKSKLVSAMLEMSKEFARRSVADCRESQMATMTTSFDKPKFDNEKSSLAGSVVDRVGGMIRWEESNHLIFVFHNQNIQTLSALYRNLDKVENDIKFLFESQMKKKMDDFTRMDQRSLQNILQKVARCNPLPLQEEKLQTLAKGYALTADNLLKMVLIMLRVKSNVPVVIMGETGCGKTSLVRYLAAICEVPFDVLNIHAGVTEQDIIKKVMECNNRAIHNLDSDLWLFLDEINTSESIGVIGDILCHHSCLGKDLAPNLVVMAACNPYRLRTSAAISTAGLDSKVKTDELSKLVYRVLPLPEMLVDFVWDFGTLSEKDEEKYIYRMTDDVFVNDEEHHELFACLLTASQEFVRTKESSSYSVSLRDVQRCKTLTKWFMTILLEKNILNDTCEWDCDTRLKAMILSLAHCYHSRFADKKLRKEYRTIVAKVLALHKCVPVSENYDEFFLGVMKAEQRDILDRMELPPGTACNSALQENVFVILVCIFNRIPIFVVGKPGCSKSLAMQLIRSNLRGKDSKDDFFRTLPQLYCVSFQGSESSTSDGILKVFEKAEKYQQSNSREDVLSVVILDEIGLAEISRFNPLKVLHNLLEPEGKSQPNVAVVGISNWALDASKMNRAIHLSRTDMDTEELYETAISISRSFLEAEKSEAFFEEGVFETAVSTKDIEGELYGIADAYTKYIEQMRFKNFHGLRDYYSLVKYIARMFAEKGSDLEDNEKADLILVGLERNFGGLPAEKQTLYDVFQRCMSTVPLSKNSVVDLITQNIQDPVARHMMLITTGEAMLGIVKQKLSEIGCSRKEVIYGSQFEEDLTDDYNYRILSRIILCMEEGIVLILKDLESIYGSLYDMLNQNYTVIGKKKNCRVALGAYSNPICYVADSFRCIVLIEETKLDLSDPPFLNRFEKQYLRFSDILGEKDRTIITEIEKWMDDLASVDKPPVRKEDMFPIYDADMSASLVLKHTLDRQDALSGKEKDIRQIMDDCLNELLWVIKPEVVVQLRSSSTFQYENSKANSIVSKYFSLPVHEGFDALLNYQMNLDEDLMCVVFTNSNLHTKVSELTEITLQVEKLGAFKSEKQLSSRIQHFWDRDDCAVLVVQCNAKDDQRHILLTKLVIERYRDEYLLQASPRKRKYVYLIIHLDRTKGEATCLSQLNFLSQWHLVMLDSIEKSTMPLPELCKLTLLEAVEQRRPLTNCLKDELFWAFTRIKYGSQSRDVESLSQIIDTIENSEEFLELLDREVWEYIRNHMSTEENRNWQRNVAKDKMLLNTSTGLVDALERFVMETIKRPLCKFIYKIELFGIADSFFDTAIAYLPGDEKHDVISQKQKTWLSLLHDASVFSIDDVPDESGPECYNCDTVHLGLKMPFSRSLFDSIESTKEDFLEVVRTYKVHCLLSEDDELPVEIYEEVLSQQEAFILQKMPDLKKFLYTNWTSDYLEDFCNIMSSRICNSLSGLERIYYAKLIVKQFCDVSFDDPFIFLSHLHTKCWVNQTKIRAELLLIEASLLVIPGVGNEIENILLPAKRTCLKGSASPNLEVIKTDDSIIQALDGEPRNGCRESINDIKEGDVLFESVTTTMDDVESTLEPVSEEVDSHETNTFKELGSEAEVTETAINLEFQNDSEIENENDRMKRATNWHDTGARAYIEATDTTSAADRLVHFLCTNMLPSDDCIDVHSGIDCWVNKVMSALSLAYQVSHTPKILFSLRICCEIACELFLPYSLDVQLLTKLGNLLQNGCHLDEKEVFESICNIIEAAGEKKHIENDVCMRLLSSYCVMCISADQDTNVLDFLFVLIEEGKVPQECTHLFKAPLLLAFNLLDKSVLSDIILLGINPDPALTDVTCLSQESVEKDYEQEKILLKIDEMIRILFRNGGGPHSILVLITDIFQHLYLSELSIGRAEDQQNQKKDVQNFEDDDRTPILEDPVNVFYACHKLFTERSYGLQYVASVAYIKTFMNNVFEQGIDMDKEEFDRIMIPCETVISDEINKMCSRNIGIFFLKAFMTGRSLIDVKKFTDSHQDIPFMKMYEWTPGYVESSTENSPLCMYLRRGIHEEYKSIHHTSFEFNIFREKMEALLDLATKDQQACLCAFSFAMKEFYLRKYMESLDDTKRTLASYMCNTAIDKHLDGNSLMFLRKLTGEENFSLPELEMTEEIPREQFCKVSFCITWVATCLGSFQINESSRRSVFIECLFAQISKKKILLPGFRKEERDIKFPLDAPDEGWLVDCSCGSKIYCFGPSRIVTCIVCKANVESWTPIHTSPEPAEGKRGVLSFDMDETCFGVSHLQPVACHLLRMLTIASLIGSFELGTTRKTLEQLTGIAEFEVIQELWNNFQSHWGHLIELLNMDDSNLKMLLHVVVSHSRDLFFTTEAPGSEESLLAWEKEFEKIISPILEARYLEIQKLLIMSDRIHGFECPGLEQKLFEIDEVKHNGTEARSAKEIEITVENLFRTNTTPTKTNFLSELYPKRNAFPCLSHVLENEARLKLPIHAINIIKWHIATVSIANYVMKKNDCLKMSVQDFIFYKQSIDSSKSSVVLQRFDEFRKSWEVLKESLEDEELAAKMKHIHIGSSMSECLLLEENSVVKEVLSALLFIQNDCLDGMMKYASRTNALKFLFRVCDIAVVPSVQMTNLTPEDMICCNVDWDSLLLQESQCDLSYGQGKHIHYDFHNIEQAVAVAVFSGRSFVQIDDSLPKIVFLDELHMNYSSMIRDLLASIYQDPLPQEIAHSIKMKKDDDPRMASQLLNQLGLVMTLLKKTKGDPDTPLIEYVDSWKSLLGREFPRKSLPSPETSIKLSHVVALNELLEELCAETMKNGMQDEFRIKLDLPLQGHLSNVFKDEDLTVMFLKALKRFSFRCVLSKTADPNQMLRRYISDDSFWPHGSISNDILAIGEKKICLSDIIPDGLMVHHTFACLTTIEAELEKKRKENIKLTSFATSFNVKTKSSPLVKTTQKKKMATTFRKF